MIKEIDKKDIEECVGVIRENFLTVANEFGFTMDNAPRFTAFALKYRPTTAHKKTSRCREVFTSD